MPDKIRRWIVLHPNWTLTFITLAALAPFLAKPFNIDDPLFIRAAQQILLHPGNPYGFDVNWYGTATPMWVVTKNPPLACYYLALAGGISGWSEMSLHFALLLPAVAAILGTFRLARHFCNHPLPAALLTLSMPVFLVSSTTVMCDVMMLAFWVWAVVFWIEGTGKNDFRKLSAAGLLIGLAALTKYYGICLVPLLAAFSLINERRLGRWLACLLIPLLMLCIYQWAVWRFYGYEFFSGAVNYAAHGRDVANFSTAESALIGLAFAGGCLATVAFFAPLLWRAGMLAAFAGGTVLFAGALFFAGAFFSKYQLIQGTALALVEIQIVLWASGGICALALAVGEILHRRDARSWLLALWVLGTFLFATFINWTINGRSILPMAPAVAILLVRRLERMPAINGKTWTRGASISLAAGAVLGLMVARSDYVLAASVRESARQTFAKYGGGQKTLWFQGHWGFQYYMEVMGAAQMDLNHSPLKTGDYLALPWNNTNVNPLKPEFATRQEILVVPRFRILTTVNVAAGSGFYWSGIGPLPFVFGSAPPEKVAIFSLNFSALSPASN